MSLAITDTMITSDVTAAFAVFRPYAAIDGRCGAWVMSTRSGRLFDRCQAISAMTIEEEKARPEPDQALIASLESELR